MKRYCFYDLETSGLGPFDQILEFACIIINEQFEEISREQFYVRPNPDTVIAPDALITHRIGFDKLATGISEYEAACRIHTIFNTPNTISVGYNSLGFDDEFLRFCFFRHLLPPYTHQFKNGCARLDIYPITLMYYLFDNDSLSWPEREGKTSLKLEDIAAANGLAFGQAHHALVDVETTLALANRLRNHNKERWDFCCSLQSKAYDTSKTPQRIDANSEAILCNGKLGANNHYQSWCLYLGNHHVYKNQGCWLRLDDANLQKATLESFQEHAWVINKKWGEPPMVMPTDEKFTARFTEERRRIIGENRAWITEHPETLEAIKTHYLSFTFPDNPDCDAQARLYLDAFPCRKDTDFMAQFHRSAHKAEIVPQFRSLTLRALATRVIGKYFPECLTPSLERDYQEYLSRFEKRLDAQNRPCLSTKAALERIAALQEEGHCDSEQFALLDALTAKNRP